MATRRIPDADLAKLVVLLKRGEVKIAVDLVGSMRRAPVVGRRGGRKRPPGEELPERLRPDDTVDCGPFGARLTLAECVRRSSAKTASGAGRGYPVHERCQMCPMRDVHQAMIPTFNAPAFRPFNISKDRVQREARSRLWKTGQLDSVPTIDSPNGEE
jgi:hypothetical protein